MQETVETSVRLDTGAGAQHHVARRISVSGGLMASKDKGSKATKKPAKQTLKEKRKAKKTKKTS
ncbi:MAG TPA: hypothetical protein VHV50_09715 [Actinomycetota bacterium]|nr:hypothetical protein [Actinomycetota bacterium]